VSDQADRADGTGDELPPWITADLARPETWEVLPVAVEDAVVDTILAARAAAPASRASVTSLGERRERHGAIGWWLAAAAAAVVVLTGVVTLVRGGPSGVADGDGIVAALVGTELAPDASGTATFESTPAGLKIVLDTDALPSAADGEMYEAWISNGEIRICAGSFHLRGGEGPIELWAGTADPSFHLVTVTREPIDGDTDSSGIVMLRGEFELPGD
jgi:hypothetical protein